MTSLVRAALGFVLMMLLWTGGSSQVMKWSKTINYVGTNDVPQKVLTVAGQSIYVLVDHGNGSSSVFRYDWSGNFKWRYLIANPTSAIDRFANGDLFIRTANLHCIRVAVGTGKTLWDKTLFTDWPTSDISSCVVGDEAIVTTAAPTSDPVARHRFYKLSGQDGAKVMSPIVYEDSSDTGVSQGSGAQLGRAWWMDGQGSVWYLTLIYAFDGTTTSSQWYVRKMTFDGQQPDLVSVGSGPSGQGLTVDSFGFEFGPQRGPDWFPLRIVTNYHDNSQSGLVHLSDEIWRLGQDSYLLPDAATQFVYHSGDSYQGLGQTFMARFGALPFSVPTTATDWLEFDPSHGIYRGGNLPGSNDKGVFAYAAADAKPYWRMQRPVSSECLGFGVGNQIVVALPRPVGQDTGSTLEIYQQARLSIGPATVFGNTSVTGKLSLAEPAPAGGLTFNLYDTSPSVTPDVSTVTIPAGQKVATFTCTVKDSVLDQDVEISAKYLYGYTLGSFHIRGYQLASHTISPATWNRLTSKVTGTVKLDRTALSNVVVNLSGSLNLPASVLIPAGKGQASYTISVPPDSAVGQVIVHAVLPQGPGMDAGLFVNPNQFDALGADPSQVAPGHSTTVTATFGIPASEGGLVLAVSSNAESDLIHPPTVTLPAGQQTVSFTVDVQAGAPAETVELTVTDARGFSRVVELTIGEP